MNYNQKRWTKLKLENTNTDDLKWLIKPVEDIGNVDDISKELKNLNWSI